MNMLASPMGNTADANSAAAAGSQPGEVRVSRLEEARILVRARRQEVKDRQAAVAAAAAAAAAATGTAEEAAASTAGGRGNGRDRVAVTKGPGGTTAVAAASSYSAAPAAARPKGRQVDVAAGTRGRNTGSGSRAWRGYSPRGGRPGTAGRAATRGAGRRGVGGVKRRRVLPDFTKATPKVVPVASGGEATGQDREDDEALVAAIRVTLEQTAAQLAGRKPAAPVLPAVGGALPYLPHGATQQVRVRALQQQGTLLL